MGFDADKFVSGITEDKKCGVCGGVLDNPVRAACGHLYCSGCILPWVVRHGSCPQGCQPLTPGDLENVLPLREIILNLQVRCEYRQRGCQAVVRLTDLIAHIQDCSYRPVTCGHPHCGATVPHRQLAEHEGVACEYRPVGICQEGCGLVLVHKTRHNHHCVTALRQLVTEQEQHVAGLEQELQRKDRGFQKRERVLLAQVTSLQRKVKQQAKRFHNQLTDLRHRLNNNNQPLNCTNLQYQQHCEPEENNVKGEGRGTGEGRVAVTLTLFRDAAGSLGFNIMGGLTVEKNNNQSSTNSDGIFISRIGEGGPGDLKGLKVNDRIMKVNGQDLSQSSHDEAVEAFRTATEPIVVEVLRRVGKSGKSSGHSHSHSSSSKSRPPSNSSSSSSSCNPAMVSIATQTEEDFYCYNRPPTPPPGFYPVHISGLYQPSSRRPVAFSPSAEMGLTDIEMSHNLDFDDPFFDDRQYEMVYEEVVLHRSSSDEKLGLTLCYGSLEDEITDIFISEIDPCSVAGRDGRVREGDQILQINGVDVHSRDEAISLFSSQEPDITLLVARPQLQIDDGFMEEPNLVLEDLHMDLLEKHHHDNMHFMASMLARTQIDEEGGTTDTATTENSSHKHEKDSGVGRTDESTRNDESSEQEMFDADSLPAPGSKLRANLAMMRGVSGSPHHYSNESVTSNDPDLGVQHVQDIPSEECDKFRHLLEYRCGVASQLQQGQQLQQQQQQQQLLLQGQGLIPGQEGPPITRKDSESSLERELAQLNKEMEDIQVECQEIVESHLLKEQQRLFAKQLPLYVQQDGAGASNGHSSGGGGGGGVGGGLKTVGDTQRSPRVVPRMGTRLDCIKHMQALEQFDLWSQQRRMALAAAAAAANSHATPSLSSGTGTSSSRSERDKDQSTTSAYNTGGESCRSTPLTLELNVASDESEKGFKNSMLCLAPSAVPHSSSDTEKQTQTPTGKSRGSSSDDSGQGVGRVAAGPGVAENLRAAGLSGQAESLQDLYMRSADIMYTNHANLQHTIAVQQKLFQQQLEQQKRLRFGSKNAPPSPPAGPPLPLPHSATSLSVDEGKQQSPNNTAPSDSGQMEWVVKRRPDGTRYITRRPVRSKILKERAKKITEERSGMTTDDDAMSELKTGRYWSKEERKRHLEKAKDYKRRKETLMKQRMETLKEGEEKKEVNIVELSHRKMNKHKNKKVLDNFVTVQEMLAHGSRIPEGKTYNPLLSVTTV